MAAVACALLAGGAGAGERTFGGTNGRLVFAATDGYLYSITSTDARLRRLVAGTSPAWAPNGRRFAFVRDDRIWIASADATQFVLLPASDSGADIQPSWSPDGQRLVIVHTVGSQSSLQIIDLTRGRRTTLTAPSAKLVYTPSWSPDGTRILFARLENDDTTHLYAVRPAGGRITRLTRGGGSHIEPSWSPRGSWVVFVRSNLGPGRLFLMRPNGRGARPLFSRAFDDVRPVWSPDGRAIAFARRRSAGGIRDLFVVELATKAVRRLTNGGPSIDRIDWQPRPRAEPRA